MTPNIATLFPTATLPSTSDETVKLSPLGSYTNCLIPRKDSDLKFGNAAPVPTVPALNTFGIDQPGAPAEFPFDAFPLLIRNLAEDVALGYQVSRCLSAMSALGVVSGAVGKSVVVQNAYKTRPTLLNLYLVPVADHACGKDRIGRTLCVPLSGHSQDLAEIHAEGLESARLILCILKKSFQQGVKEALKKPTADHKALYERLNGLQSQIGKLEADVQRRVAMLTNNTSSESLAHFLADNQETIFSYTPDAAKAIHEISGQGSLRDGVNLDLLVAAYDGSNFRLHRNPTDLNLLHPCLALLWHLQPSAARELIESRAAAEHGILARMMIFNTGARREYDNRQTHELKYFNEWTTFINSLIGRRESEATRSIITCSPAAREIFAKFDDESIDLGYGPLADCAGLLTRWRENAIKVAGLFALVEGVWEIKEELATRAIRVMRWAGYSFLAMRQAGRYERLREELVSLEQLLRDHGGQMSVGELASSHGINRGRLNAIASTFPDRVEIEIRPQVASGRPAAVVKLVLHQAKSAEGTRLSMEQSQLK
jgi:hypothetical protein